MVLKLVQSFSNADYPFVITVKPHEHNKIFDKYYFDAFSSAPAQASKQRILNALSLASVSDHRLINDGHKIKLYLKTEEDLNNIRIAMSWNDTISYSIEHDLSDISIRVLKKRCKHAADMMDKTGLRGRFFIKADKSQGRLEIITYDKPAFFKTRRIKPEEYILNIDFL